MKRPLLAAVVLSVLVQPALGAATKSSVHEKRVKAMSEFIAGNREKGRADTQHPPGPAEPLTPAPAAPGGAESDPYWIPAPDSKDPGVQRCYTDACRAYYEYRTFGFAHRKRVFLWQHYSSIAVFCFVLGLASVGTYFSWLQFRAQQMVGLGRGRGAGASTQQAGPTERAAGEGGEGQLSGPPEAGGHAVTQISASAQGISISSPILGVILLFMSLLFLYLYLAYVYPIHETF